MFSAWSYTVMTQLIQTLAPSSNIIISVIVCWYSTAMHICLPITSYIDAKWAFKQFRQDKHQMVEHILDVASSNVKHATDEFPSFVSFLDLTKNWGKKKKNWKRKVLLLEPAEANLWVWGSLNSSLKTDIGFILFTQALQSDFAITDSTCEVNAQDSCPKN